MQLDLTYSTLRDTFAGNKGYALMYFDCSFIGRLPRSPLSLKDAIFLDCVHIFSSSNKFTARLVMGQIRKDILIGSKAN